jgi:H+/Cl- antiporter ClcA
MYSLAPGHTQPPLEKHMSFREKSAWISLIAILVVAAIYFLHGPWSWPDSPPRLVHGFLGRRAHVFLLALVALLLIEVVGHIAIAMQAPREARAKADERERLISLKATRIAAYVYWVGSFTAVFTIHFGADQFTVSSFIVLAFVLAQLANNAARIVYHRRGF